MLSACKTLIGLTYANTLQLSVVSCHLTITVRSSKLLQYIYYPDNALIALVVLHTVQPHLIVCKVYMRIVYMLRHR
jgi:hypothetical protein